MRTFGRMIIVDGGQIAAFRLRHPQSRTPLESWYRVVAEADWRNFAELRSTFSSADIVNERFIFNIAGNKYRLVAKIDFDRSVVRVQEIWTHAEYSKKRY